MRKLILIAVLAFGSIAARAQQPTISDGTASKRYKIMDTTVSGSGTPIVIQPVIGGKNAVTFQYSITKNSGTVAGTIVLQGSIDGGTSYYTINTYTLTDATAATALSYANNGYERYKITVNATATQNANYKIWVLYRQ